MLSSLHISSSEPAFSAAGDALTLVLNAATPQAFIGLIDADQKLAGFAPLPAEQGSVALLAPVLQELLATHQYSVRQISLIAAVKGPGSFTGIRGSLAFAAGLGLSSGVPVIGVSLYQAFREYDPENPCPRLVATLTGSLKNDVFFETENQNLRCTPENLPSLAGEILLCGNASEKVFPALATGSAALITQGPTEPDPLFIYLAALRLLKAGVSQTDSLIPLYISEALVSVPKKNAGRPKPL